MESTAYLSNDILKMNTPDLRGTGGPNSRTSEDGRSYGEHCFLLPCLSESEYGTGEEGREQGTSVIDASHHAGWPFSAGCARGADAGG
jgi:hypothetical protein